MDAQNTHAKPAGNTSKAALGGLAVAGFIALVILGISLAIYSARFVPEAVSKLSSLASSTTSTAVSPYIGNNTSSTTIPFTPVATVTHPGYGATITTAPAQPPTTTTFPSSVSNTTSSKYTHSVYTRPAYYGLPDLSVQIVSVGFLANTSTDSFVPTTVIPLGAHPAVKFIVTNIGTNVSQPWTFSANIPSATGPLFNSAIEQSLAPGDHIDFTLGFNQTIPGPQVVSIVVDPNNQIVESTKINNYTSATIQVANQ